MADEKNYFKTYEGNYNSDELVDKLYKNSERYAAWRLEKDKNFDIEGFTNSINKIATEIQNRTLSRGKGRRYYSSALTDISSASDSAAFDLTNRVIDTLSKAPEPEREKYGDKYTLRTEFLNRFYGGNDAGEDLSLWTNGTLGASDLADMVDAYATRIEGSDLDYSDSPYTDKNDLVSRARKLSKNLRDGTVDGKDSADWVALGGEKKFFDTIFNLGPRELTPWEKEWQEVEKLYLSAGRDRNYIAQLREKFFNNKLAELNEPFNKSDYALAFADFATKNWTGAGKKIDYQSLGDEESEDILKIWSGEKTNEANNMPAWIESRENQDYADQLFNQALQGIFTNRAQDRLTDELILKLYMDDLMLYDPEQFLKIKDNQYYIIKSFDWKTGTAMAYDYDTHTFTKVHVSPTDTPILLNALKAEYRKHNPYTGGNSTGWGSIFAKNGSKLNQIKTLRDGSNILYALSGALLAQLKEQERIGAYNQSVTDRAKAKGLSEEDIRKGDVKASEDNSFNSWLRAASTYTDVAGAAASFIPVVGNAVGAVLGTAGTVGNLVADAMDDSVSSDEMWTNALTNAALTGLMLIPGGGTASLASKALKATKTAVLVGAPLYAGTLVYKNWDRVKELWNKKKKGTLSHEEARELSMYVSMMSGTVTGTKANAGKAAKHLGNNFAGKTAAAISDTYIFFSLLGGDKRAKVVFRDMLKNTRPVKTSSTSNKKGVNYEFEDANGNKFLISKLQYDAMRKAEAEGRKAGLSGEELDKKIGDAWAKNHPDGPKTYSAESTTQSKSWNVSDTDSDVKQKLTATTDPTGDVEIGGIKFSKESVKALKDAYKTASDGVTDDAIKAARNTDSVDDNLRSLYKHEVGMKAARDKFASLPESSETIAGGIIEGNPIFKMSDTGRLSKYLRKIGIGKSDLDLVDTGESSVSRFLNSGESSAFDSNSSVGRANITKRVLQRKHGRDYLANGFLRKGIGTKGADFLLNNFNTNWELANNMGGIRTRADELSDALVVRRLLLNSTEHKAKIASLELRSNFRNSDEGKKLIATEEKRLGHTLTREEVDNLANKHKLKLLKLLKSAEKARLNAEQKLGNNTEITVEQLLKIQSNVPAWKNLSYDEIQKRYDTAVEAGFSGDIVAYSKYVKDLRRAGKTESLVHQDNLDRIAQNKLDVENNLILENFKSSYGIDPSRVVAEARKLGFKGDDISIIKLLQSNILHSGDREDIVTKLKRADQSTATRQKNLADTRVLLLNGEYRMLVLKYKAANPNISEDRVLKGLLIIIRKNLTTLKTVERQYNIPTKNKARVENAILNMLNELSELSTIISKFNLTKKPQSSKFGGRLERLIELRRNFISDNSYTSDELSSFKSGGILKAEGGTQLPDWYKKYYNFDNLIGWTNELDSSNSGSLSSSNWHKKAGNLGHAYKFNDAYINSGHVGKDIQEYYNNSDISDINEFVKDYNNNIKLIDDRFHNEIIYGSSGASLGNKAYKNLYISTISNPEFSHHLGYNDSQDDIWGSTSWLRRADKYEKELKDLSDEELKLRTHVISDTNGKTYTIYKNADGTITLDKPNSDDLFDTKSDKSTGVSDNGGTATKKSKFDPELIEYLINLNIPDLLSAKRLFKNLENNRKLEELSKRKKAHYLNYVLGHENVYGDFGALMTGQLIENNLLSNANDFSKNTVNQELAAAMLLDSLLKANDSKKYYTNLDNTTIAKSKAASQAAEQERYLENLKRAETNAGTSVAKHNADIDVEMGTLSANTTNWNTWLSEQESRFRLKNLDNEELQRKLATQDLQNWWKNNVTDTPHILSLLNEYSKADATRLAEIIKEVLLERQLNEQLYSAERFNRLRKIMKGNYWGMGDDSSNFTVFKKGGKVDDSRIKRRAEDLKELRKLIRHSITTNQKALDNLSKATLLELKRMMGI